MPAIAPIGKRGQTALDRKDWAILQGLAEGQT